MIREDYSINDIGVTVSTQEKNGIYQAILSYKAENGKWKTKWKSTQIRAKKGNLKLAQKKAEQIKAEFEKELKEKFKQVQNPKNPLEAQLNMYVVDFLYMRLNEVSIKKNYDDNTYAGYKGNIDFHISDFFYNGDYKYTVRDVNNAVLDDFFTYLAVDCNLKNSTILHFKNLFSVAYDNLDKKNIKRNPIVGIEKISEQVFIPKTYNMKELNELIKIFKGDVIEIPVLLAIYYGLRRSEAIGLKWSSIDFENNWITINHTVIERSKKSNKNDGNRLVGRDKTKSIYSNRELPLYPDIKAALLEKKQRIEDCKQLFKSSYNTKYLDYVCVKDDGDLIKPNHVTHRFLKVLRRYNMKEIRYHDLRHTLRYRIKCKWYRYKSHW